MHGIETVPDLSRFFYTFALVMTVILILWYIFVFFSILAYIIIGLGMHKVVRVNNVWKDQTHLEWIPPFAFYAFILIGLRKPFSQEKKKKAKVTTVIVTSALLFSLFLYMSDITFIQRSEKLPVIQAVLGFIYIYEHILFNKYMKAYQTGGFKRFIYLFISILTLGFVQSIYIFRHQSEKVIDTDELTHQQEDKYNYLKQ